MSSDTFHISKTEIIDTVLALSALRGDVTGRGMLLVDNDSVALAAVLKTLVPKCLTEHNIEFQEDDSGWTIGPTAFDRSVLADYLISGLLFRITANEACRPGLLHEPFPSSSSKIQPFF